MNAIRAISFRQPWAWLIANGHKDFENRTRCFAPVGQTYWLHAGKNCSRDEYLLACGAASVVAPAVASAMPKLEELQRGGLVGWVRFGAWMSRMHPSPWSFGSGFIIEGAGVLPFVPCRGQLGCFLPRCDLPQEYLTFAASLP